MPEPEKMSLERACYVLAVSHTRADDVAGFVVEMGGPTRAFPEFTKTEYIEAWKAIREYVHLPVEAQALERGREVKLHE